MRIFSTDIFVPVIAVIVLFFVFYGLLLKAGRYITLIAVIAAAVLFLLSVGIVPSDIVTRIMDILSF